MDLYRVFSVAEDCILAGCVGFSVGRGEGLCEGLCECLYEVRNLGYDGEL